jgi:hypothetical protein
MIIRHRHPSLWLPMEPPTDPVDIDYGHPLAQGLVMCVLPAAGMPIYNMVAPRGSVVGVASVAAGIGMGPRGLAIDTTISAVAAHEITKPSSLVSNYTIFTYQSQPVAKQSASTLSILDFNTGSGAGQVFTYTLANGSPSFTAYNGSNALPQTITGVTLTADQRNYGWTASARINSTARVPTLNVNGRANGTATSVSTGPASIAAGAAALGLFYNLSGHTSFFSGYLYALYMYNYFMADDVARWLHNEPFAFMRPRSKRLRTLASVAQARVVVMA